MALASLNLVSAKVSASYLGSHTQKAIVWSQRDSECFYV
jgi:hypothetical protein